MGVVVPHGVLFRGGSEGKIRQALIEEATALGAMVMAGGRRARAVRVSGPGPGRLTPCGGCRQKLREFGASDLLIIAADPGGIRQQWTLEQLLPFSFGPEHLSKL